MQVKFQRFVKRSEMGTDFQFGDCAECKATVIWATIKTTLKRAAFDPKSVGGSEIDRLYDRHICR